MDPNKMKRKDFESLPRVKWDETVICDSLIIIPSKKLHESGFRCLAFASVVGNTPTNLISGCSDVIHIEGIGGYRAGEISVPAGWFIDCLRTSGLLRIWNTRGRIRCGFALSSFEIFSLPNKTEGGK